MYIHYIIFVVYLKKIKMTIIDCIEKALEQGKLNYGDVRKIVTLMDGRNTIDRQITYKESIGEDVKSEYKQIEMLTAQIEIILDRSKMPASQRLRNLINGL